MNSSSLVPLNSSLGSSPSAKHTAQAIVLSGVISGAGMQYLSRTVLAKDDVQSGTRVEDYILKGHEVGHFDPDDTTE